MNSEYHYIVQELHDHSAAVNEALLRFAGDLVRIPSLTGQEEQIAHFIAETMRNLDYDEVMVDEYGSVIGRIGNGSLKIIFDAHIDTVAVHDTEAWKFEPFAGTISEGKLYGRGASDMKAAVAAIVYAGQAIKKLGLDAGKTIYISTSTLEEDYDGEALYHICQQLEPHLAVICEPSNNNIVLGQKGRAVLRIDLPGISAHGSAPEKGDNAVYKAAKIIRRIEELGEQLITEEGAEGSLALTRIESEAVSLNAVPTRCSLYLDRRLVIGQDLAYITEEMTRLLQGEEESGATWDVHLARGLAWTGREVCLHSFLPAWEIALDHTLTKACLATYQELFDAQPSTCRWDFSTNGVATAKLGIPTIGFGPGDDKMAHMRDEYADVSQITAAMELYTLLIARLEAF